MFKIYTHFQTKTGQNHIFWGGSTHIGEHPPPSPVGGWTQGEGRVFCFKPGKTHGVLILKF